MQPHRGSLRRFVFITVTVFILYCPRYRRLALKFHPSSNRDPGSTEKFSQLGEAYDVLSDRELNREQTVFFTLYQSIRIITNPKPKMGVLC